MISGRLYKDSQRKPAFSPPSANGTARLSVRRHYEHTHSPLSTQLSSVQAGFVPLPSTSSFENGCTGSLQ